MTLNSKALFFTVGLALAASPPLLCAASLQVTVKDNGNNGVENAVVYATPVAGLSAAERQAEPRVIDQVDKEFVPHVAVFQKGTTVAFPNHDNIRHHVYSFSEAKTFEIPLYKGTPTDPVEFDKEGVVSLGCNIHDWMWAHILVTDTPYFAMTDAQGKLVIDDLPPGEYRVKVWHHQQQGSPEASTQTVELAESSPANVEFLVKKKKIWVPFRAPSQAMGSYR